MSEQIMVSIICNAYNHEKYIGEALDSFLMQETSFPFEVLVHDDASTDGTADIIREYEKKHGDIIKPYYQTENQYSKGIPIRTFQLPRARGKYIAFCEGDDYWLDPLKLQKQVDALEAHPEVDMCACASTQVHAETKAFIGKIAPYDAECISPTEDVIMGEGEFFSTNSLVYRKSMDDHFPPFRQFMILDYTLQIHGSLRGGVIYLPDCMAAYRLQVPGSWTFRMKNKEKQWAFLQKKNQMLDILNADTQKKFDCVISLRKQLNETNYYYRYHMFKKAFSKEYRQAHAHLGVVTMGKRLVRAAMITAQNMLKKK